MSERALPASTFNMRLTEEDRERLALLVEQMELPATMVVRQLLKREVEALGERTAKKTAKKKAARR